MSKIEYKIIEFFERNKIQIFLLVITGLAVLVRYQARGFQSSDMEYYLLPWYEEIKQNGGLKALGNQVGNYNIAYQVCIALMTYIPIHPMFSYKGVSILFDFLLAIVAALSLYEFSNRKNKIAPVIVYAVVLFLPTILLNSAFWGQCDSIYSFFVVWALYFLKRDYCKWAYVMLGIAVAFKLQAIFILPFFLMFYVIEKRCSIFCIFLSLISFYCMSLPGIICGRSIWEPFELYLDQKGAWAALFSNFPSFLVFFGNKWEAYEAIAPVTFLFIIVLLGMMLLYLLHKKTSLHQTKFYYAVAAWTLWTCVIFLPEMHERYAYLVDVLLILAVVDNMRYLIAVLPALFTGIITYSYYLFHVDYDLVGLSVVYIVAYSIYTFLLVREISVENPSKVGAEEE